MAPHVNFKAMPSKIKSTPTQILLLLLIEHCSDEDSKDSENGCPTATGNESETHKSKCPLPKSLSNPSTLTPPPIPPTGNDSETESLCDFDLHKSKCPPPKSLSNPSTLTPPPTPLTWQELNSNLQAVFPTDDTYTYIVENYQSKELETFPGAPGIAFDTQVRINLRNDGEAINGYTKCSNTAMLHTV